MLWKGQELAPGPLPITCDDAALLSGNLGPERFFSIKVKLSPTFPVPETPPLPDRSVEVSNLRHEDNGHILKVKLGKCTGWPPSYTRLYKDGLLLTDQELSMTLLSNGITKGKELSATAVPHEVPQAPTMRITINDDEFAPV